VMLGVVINAAARGWWVAAGLTLLFDAARVNLSEADLPGITVL